MMRNNILKKVLITGMIAILGTSILGCKENKSNNINSLDKDQLVIGLDDTFVPMGFKNENGDLTGFDVELAEAVAKKLDKKIKFQAIDWSMKETELSGGNIDLIWNGYSINDERKEKVDFSKAYLDNTQIIVTLSDSNINSKDDLKDKRVGAQNDSTAVSAVESDGDIIKSFKDGKLITFEDNNQALMDLEAGRLDAIVVDEILARYYIKERGESKYKILKDNFGDEQYGIGVRKGDDKLLSALNNALSEVVEDGEAAEISKKWFGEDIVIK